MTCIFPKQIILSADHIMNHMKETKASCSIPHKPTPPAHLQTRSIAKAGSFGCCLGEGLESRNQSTKEKYMSLLHGWKNSDLVRFVGFLQLSHQWTSMLGQDSIHETALSCLVKNLQTIGVLGISIILEHHRCNRSGNLKDLIRRPVEPSTLGSRQSSLFFSGTSHKGDVHILNYQCLCWDLHMYNTKGMAFRMSMSITQDARIRWWVLKTYRMQA